MRLFFFDETVLFCSSFYPVFQKPLKRFFFFFPVYTIFHKMSLFYHIYCQNKRNCGIPIKNRHRNLLRKPGQPKKYRMAGRIAWRKLQKIIQKVHTFYFLLQISASIHIKRK